MTLDTARQMYFGKKIKDANNDQKVVWKAVKQVQGVTGKGGGGGAPMKIYGSNGMIISDPKSVADGFVNYLTEFGLSNVPVSDSCPYDRSNDAGSCVMDSLFLAPVTIEGVERVLGRLNSKKTKGPDRTSNFVLKLGRRLLAPCIAHLINLMISSGCFPECFKVASIKLIYKGGDRLSVSNYRPISILSALGKVFERFIFDQLYSFLERNNAICPEQFGFRKGRGADMAVASLVEYVKSGLNDREYVVMVSLDVRKAFDTVNHRILLQKLDFVGVRGVVKGLIASFLNGRTQFVDIQNFRSEVRPVFSGVPQGSILGPLLFTVFINDLVRCRGDSEMFLYADDSAICVRGNSLSDTIDVMQHVLDDLLTWFENNLLNLNLDKCKLLIFGSPWKLANVQHAMHTFFVTIRGIFLLPEETVVYLGVILDKHLKWWNHIAMLKSKLSRVIVLLYRFRKVFLTNVLLLIFHSLFQSIVSYCVSSYGCTHMSKLNSIWILQKQAVRVIFFLGPLVSVHSWFRKYGILSVFMLNIKAVLMVGCKLWGGDWVIRGVSLLAYSRGDVFNLRILSGVRLKENRYVNDFGRFMLNVRIPFLVNRLCDLGCDVLAVLPLRRVGGILRGFLCGFKVEEFRNMF